jgi:ATP-dependent Lon protease
MTSPQEVRDEIEFLLVKSLDEVFEHALLDPVPDAKRGHKGRLGF